MTTSTSTAPVSHQDLSRIAQDLQIRKIHVESVVQLLDEGNTVPFITRYRKERTGGMNEEVIRRIQHRVGQLRQLTERKNTILKSIEGQGKLTDALREAIVAADSPKRLEDLYLPFKPKKRSLATDAREKGLEPLALAIWTKDPVAANLNEVVQGMINPEKGLNSPDEILAGVKNILAEIVSEQADLRGSVRRLIWDTAQIVSTKHENVPEGKGQEYKGYFEFKESAQTIPPHRILAINRGEKENALKVKLEYDPSRVKMAALESVPLSDHPHRDLIVQVIDDAVNRLVAPSIEREVRRELTEFALDHAVSIFARNLRSLLLQPPLRGKRILGVDPGLRTGCKLAVLDEHGNVLQHEVIYPHTVNRRDEAFRRAEARMRLEELIRKHQLSVIAIGNGTACRETEKIVSELITDLEARQFGGEPKIELPAPKSEQPPEAAAPTSPPAVEKADAEVVTIPASEETAVSAPETITATMYRETPPIQVFQTESGLGEKPKPIESTAEIQAPTEPPMSAEPPVTVAPPESETATVGEAPPPALDQTAAAAEPIQVAAESAPVTAAPKPVHQPRPLPELPKIDFAALPNAPADLAYVVVNEAGASDYSASDVAREEFPDFDATVRSTISIGRRLQDPLAELVKIDPQHVGVGLYQHDVKAKHLRESLDAVVESCVNHVGVDLNTASVPLLRHVSGMNALVARELVEHRKKNGPFKNRDEVQAVAGVGPQRFTQAAGFLKIPGGDEPFDETWIHPESYPVARKILEDVGFAPADLRDKAKVNELNEKFTKIHPEVYAERFNTGIPTVKDIFDALAKPARDPREDLPPPVFRKNILKIEDLSAGMELKGTVLNVVDFGAFVDIGLKDSGLVHISQMANRYIKNPYEVVSVGDVVTVWVRTVDMERRHVSLTMIAPGAERKPPERRQGPPREGPPPREPREPRREGPPPRREQRAPVGQGQGQGQGPPRDQGPRDHGPRDQGPPRGRGRGQRNFRRGPQGQPGEAPAAQAAPPPPPRPQGKPKPLPKLTQDALKGKAPLFSFGELAAFFKAKEEPPEAPKPVEQPPPPADAPAAEAPPAT